MQVRTDQVRLSHCGRMHVRASKVRTAEVRAAEAETTRKPKSGEISPSAPQQALNAGKKTLHILCWPRIMKNAQARPTVAPAVGRTCVDRARLHRLAGS